MTGQNGYHRQVFHVTACHYFAWFSSNYIYIYVCNINVYKYHKATFISVTDRYICVYIMGVHGKSGTSYTDIKTLLNIEKINIPIVSIEFRSRAQAHSFIFGT